MLPLVAIDRHLANERDRQPPAGEQSAEDDMRHGDRAKDSADGILYDRCVETRYEALVVHRWKLEPGLEAFGRFVIGQRGSSHDLLAPVSGGFGIDACL